MNPVNEALVFIKRRIPRAILQKAMFGSLRSRYRTVETLEALIRDKIIYSIAVADCNMSGGISKVIDLSGAQMKVSDDQEQVMIIPMSLTDNKRIVSALHVDISPPSAGGAGAAMAIAAGGGGATTGQGEYCQKSHSPLMALAKKGLDASTGTAVPYISNTNVEIVGNNSIRITNFPPGIVYRSLSCFVENDEDMNNISARSIPDFRQLCLLAAKSYIYNTIVIEMDESEIHMGAALGVFKTVVEDYSSAGEEYDDFLENTMGVVLFINDGDQYDRYMDSMMPPK